MKPFQKYTMGSPVNLTDKTTIRKRLLDELTIDTDCIFLGIWLCWNDKQDSLYLYRNNNEIKEMALDDYKDWDYYKIPLQTGKTSLIKPFYFELEGEQVLMTTLSIPVMRDKKIVAVLGLDIKLDVVKEIFSELVFSATAYTHKTRDVESAFGLSEVSSNIAGVNNAVADTAKEIGQVKLKVSGLEKLSEDLKSLLGQFRM